MCISKLTVFRVLMERVPSVHVKRRSDDTGWEDENGGVLTRQSTAL